MGLARTMAAGSRSQSEISGSVARVWRRLRKRFCKLSDWKARSSGDAGFFGWTCRQFRVPSVAISQSSSQSPMSSSTRSIAAGSSTGAAIGSIATGSSSLGATMEAIAASGAKESSGDGVCRAEFSAEFSKFASSAFVELEICWQRFRQSQRSREPGFLGAGYSHRDRD